MTIPLRFCLVAVLAVTACGSGTATPPATTRPTEIEAVFPEPAAQILSQGEVGADVPQGWAFSLTIDITAIPDDQLEKTPPLGIYRFKPRPGRIIERLSRGDHTARIEIVAPDGSQAVTYSWSFRVSA